MFKHSMLLGKAVTEHSNPGQTPVQGMDQPIYAIAKQIQWKWTDTLGGDKFVLMLGACWWKQLRDSWYLVDGSGFSYVISEAGVLTSCCAETVSSPTPDHDLKRMQYVHQVFLLAGSILKNETFEGLQASDSVCQKDEWDASMRNESRQFAYWSLVLDLEMLHCRFVRSLREGDFDLYVQVIDALCGWLFIFDQTHYSRWLPVHVKDMAQLQHRHPEVLQEFRRGNFVVQKSGKKFSLILKDPSHEQTTRLCKSASGVANLFDMPQTMDEHVMALSEKLQALNDFEDVTDIFTSFHHLEHHEEGSSYQEKFAKDVLSVLKLLRPKNPFSLQNGCDLVSLYTREAMLTAVAQTLCNAYALGEKRHEEFVCERLEKVPLTDTIKRVSLQTFAKRTDTKSKDNNKVNARKMCRWCPIFFITAVKARFWFR